MHHTYSFWIRVFWDTVNFWEHLKFTNYRGGGHSELFAKKYTLRNTANLQFRNRFWLGEEKHYLNALPKLLLHSPLHRVILSTSPQIAVLKLSTSTTWNCASSMTEQILVQTNLTKSSQLKDPITWSWQTWNQSQKFWTNLESQTWNRFQLFLTNFELLGCVDGWVGCAAAPEKKSWLENKKPPHWSGESFLNIWIMCRKYYNYDMWFVLLFRTLCQSLQCCGKSRHAWEKSVVNDFGLLFSIQLFDVILWTGS